MLIKEDRDISSINNNNNEFELKKKILYEKSPEEEDYSKDYRDANLIYKDFYGCEINKDNILCEKSHLTTKLTKGQKSEINKIKDKKDINSEADILLKKKRNKFKNNNNNPASHHRPENFIKACKIMLEYKSPETPSGFVKNINREGEISQVMTLKEIQECDLIDMSCTVIIGNSQSYILDGKIITSRGYKLGIHS